MNAGPPDLPARVGRYQVIERIGRGGMAEVFLARAVGPGGIAKYLCIKRMLPDLRAWEARRTDASPRLLIVSTGSAADNRAQGLAAPVLLDEDFATGHAFGASGTPQAGVAPLGAAPVGLPKNRGGRETGRIFRFLDHAPRPCGS